ncbi:cygnin-like [Colius striatus]|uniref:cygnin-like n=1 Tax=Colius striatus TaxID=57412 RepID=UPI002B1E7068|nr:cygnin-like [Colius striatus]
MRFLYLIFAVVLLVSLTVPGYGQIMKHCPDVGYCASKCTKVDVWAHSYNCKKFCCIPPIWKGK